MLQTEHKLRSISCSLNLCNPKNHKMLEAKRLLYLPPFNQKRTMSTIDASFHSVNKDQCLTLFAIDFVVFKQKQFCHYMFYAAIIGTCTHKQEVTILDYYTDINIQNESCKNVIIKYGGTRQADFHYLPVNRVGRYSCKCGLPLPPL